MTRFIQRLTMLTEQQISDFQALYRNRFGKEIGCEQAMESGIKLIRLMQLIYHPMTKSELEAITKWKTQ